ncbi:hypothetical protein [Novosphingobium sp.]|uniref:hypothetical protein n=1 Tax=Novosphingobium sp. TaxID=1874826 RepID=UPI00286D6BF3|nr:hypothetical protein [Novosphingobium sp.]
MPSAIEQVLTALRTPLEAAGLNIEVDRDEADILAGAEYPCVALSWGGSTLELLDNCNSYLWRASVTFDCWAQVKTGQSVLAQCAAQAGTVAQVIQTEMQTSRFGGLFFDANPVAVGDFANLTEDTGTIAVTAEILFQTPKGDWNTILT